MLDHQENFQIGDDIALPALAQFLGCPIDDVEFDLCDGIQSGYLTFYSTHISTGNEYLVKVALDSNNVNITPAPSA